MPLYGYQPLFVKSHDRQLGEWAKENILISFCRKYVAVKGKKRKWKIKSLIYYEIRFFCSKCFTGTRDILKKLEKEIKDKQTDERNVKRWKLIEWRQEETQTQRHTKTIWDVESIKVHQRMKDEGNKSTDKQTDSRTKTVVNPEYLSRKKQATWSSGREEETKFSPKIYTKIKVKCLWKSEGGQYLHRQRTYWTDTTNHIQYCQISRHN